MTPPRLTPEQVAIWIQEARDLCCGTGHSGHLHDELCPTCAGGRWQE